MIIKNLYHFFHENEKISILSNPELKKVIFMIKNTNTLDERLQY